MKLDYELYSLDNKLKVLLIPTDSTNSVSVHALINSGAAFEDEKTQGITHLVEHMALTCTESWPSKEILNTESEFIGGSLNGSTGKESLEYYITLPYTNINFGVKVIFEILFKSLITEKNLKTEKTVIIDEISKSIDDIVHLNGDFIDNLLYEPNNVYKYDIAGTKDTVKNFTIDQVKEHYKFAHSPQKVLLTVTGNFETDKVKKLIDETFGKIKYEEKVLDYVPPVTKVKLSAAKENPKTELIFADVIFKYKGLDAISFKESLIADITKNLLSGPMSSRLKKRLREEEGLLYNISMGAWVYRYFGNIAISYEIEPRNFKKCFTILNEELEKLLEKGITQKELKHYQEHMINRWLLRYDDPKSYSRLIKYPIFLGLPVKHLEEMINELKNISVDDVNNFVKENLNIKDANYFAFGNIQNDTEEFMKNNRP